MNTPAASSVRDHTYDQALWGGMSVIDWLRRYAPHGFVHQQAFIQVVRQHALVPFVVRDVPVSHHPAAVWCEMLRGWWAYQLRDNLRRTGELVAVLRAMEAEQLHPLTFKGPVLAQMTHGNVGARMFADLDIAVRPDEMSAAVTVLRARGYVPSFDFTPAQFSVFVRGAYHLAFTHTDTRDVVELHWHLVPAVFRPVFDERQMWARQRCVILAGHPVMTLSAEDTMHFLALHGAKHRWRRLAWIYDFARLAALESSLDWSALKAEAKARGSDRILSLAQALTVRLRQSSLADEPSVIRQLADTAWAHLWDRRREKEQDDRSFQFAALERWRDKAHFGASCFFAPTHKDLESVTLPATWRSLYYAVRPFRLLRERALGT